MHWYEKLASWSEARGWKRVIMDHSDRTKEYMHRFGLFGDPKIEHKWFATYIHHILMSDDDTLHSHPQAYIAIILKGSYKEHTRHGAHVRRPGHIRLRSAASWHRIESLSKDGIWTLFIALPRVHKWWFLVRGKCVYYKKHLNII